MTIRVLHVFSPNYKNRFAGPVIQWRFYFTRWNEPSIRHMVLDTQINQMVDSREVFDFQYTGRQFTTSKWERIFWIPTLFNNLLKFRRDFDLLHVHVLWWGGLLIGPWATWNKSPAIYESVLFGVDTPGGILQERFGRMKLWCLRQYSGILAISDHMAQDYLDNGFSSSQVFLHMNSVETDLFRPTMSAEEKKKLRGRLNIPIDSTVLLFVGSVIERKGVDILIQAFVDSCKIHPELLLVIVGARNRNENPSIDEEFIFRQHQLLDNCGMKEKVIFHGLCQDRENLAEIYRAADMFVFPSRNEGLPSVLLEAMSSGLPVITSDLPVLEKVIKDGVNGLVIPMDNSESLAQAIIKVYENEELAKELGNAARTYIEENHRFQTWQKELTGFYQRLHDQNGL